MELTGKCKDAFDNWLLSHFNKGFLEGNKREYEFYSLNWFKYFTNSMQYGVYVDFFLANEMYLWIKPKEHLYSIYIDWHGHHLLAEYVNLETLSEARIEAIKKANEIFNNI